MNFVNRICFYVLIVPLLCSVIALPSMAQAACHCHETNAVELNSPDISIIAQAPQPAPPFKRLDRSSQVGLQQGGQASPQETGDPLNTGLPATYIQGNAIGTTLQAQVEHEAGPVNILFLIDSSQSMKEGLGGGTPKMEAAKQVLQNAISNIPSDVNLGLRVFGQRFTGDPMADCSATQLLVPVGTGNRRSIIEQVRQLRPFGMTPLTFALMQAARDLTKLPGPKTLILISDGAETCGGDPCAYIRRLNGIGIKIKVDIVGLGLKRDREAKAQLNCIAETSGGKYYDANTSGELVDSIMHSVNTAIQGRVLTKLKSPAENIETPPDTNGEPGSDPIFGR